MPIWRRSSPSSTAMSPVILWRCSRPSNRPRRHEHRANRLPMRNQPGRSASLSAWCCARRQRRAARVLPSPPRWALSVAGCSSLPTPGPLRSTRGHARLRRYCAPAHPPVLRPCQRGAKNGWTGQTGTPAPLAASSLDRTSVVGEEIMSGESGSPSSAPAPPTPRSTEALLLLVRQVLTEPRQQ